MTARVKNMNYLTRNRRGIITLDGKESQGKSIKFYILLSEWYLWI